MSRKTRLRMERLASQGCFAHFDSGLAAYPPSMGQPFSLTRWARTHLEAQLDSARAQELVRELAGARLCLVSEFLPHAADLDSTDQRIVEAMTRPRRLDQIWPLARAPRFRLLCFVHFLRSVGALEESGVAAARRPPIGSPARQAEALRTLGLPGFADKQQVKRAYRRLARQLHPDLNETIDPTLKRIYEQRLANVNSAYRELMQPR
jgi:DnaJ-domain-containing protein 1